MAERSERAEAVRALLREARHGLLSTNGMEPPGFPYGSLVPCAVTADGLPSFLVSAMAQHTKNLSADGRASLLVQAPAAGDPQQAPRATLLGRARRLAGPEESDARVRYLSLHPGAGRYFDLDFGLWALEPVEARFIGGFGAAAWVPGSEIVGV